MTAAPGQRWKIGPAAATASEERRMGVLPLLSSPLLNSATMVSPVLDWIMYLQGAPDRICTSRAMTLLASMRLVLRVT